MATIFIPEGTIPIDQGALYLERAAVRDLFTFDEKKAIESSIDAGVMVYRQDLAAREVIDITSAKFSAGLAYLVSVGLLTADRAAAIAANVQG